MKDDKYNTEYKNWIILEYTGKKKADGHKIYEVQCPYCGYKKEATLGMLYYANPNCNHVIIKAKWPNENLRIIYKHMLKRCYRESCKDYRWYGAKGITIYDIWKDNPQEFIKWALANGYEEGLTIDRIDSNKDYCPENCRWITREENAKFKSTTNIYTVNGISDSGKGWARTLHRGKNFVNRYAKNHTKEETELYISELLSSI